MVDKNPNKQVSKAKIPTGKRTGEKARFPHSDAFDPEQWKHTALPSVKLAHVDRDTTKHIRSAWGLARSLPGQWGTDNEMRRPQL